MIHSDTEWFRVLQNDSESFSKCFRITQNRFKLILKMIQTDSETNSEWIPDDSQWARITQTLMDVCSAWCSTSISGLNCKSGPAPRKSLSAFLLPTNIERCSLYGGYYLLRLCVCVCRRLPAQETRLWHKEPSADESAVSPPEIYTSRRRQVI